MTSPSWPTAEITGIGDAAMARATASLLNACKSSSDPPPRPRMSVSARQEPAARRRAVTSEAGAPSPWTRAGYTRMSVHGARRLMIETMSRTAAPSKEVTTPTQAGYSGSGRFLSPSSSPSASKRPRNRSKAMRQSPSPCADSS